MYRIVLWSLFFLFPISLGAETGEEMKARGTVTPALVTCYAPGPNDNIEGPWATSRPRPSGACVDGEGNIPMTLDAVRLGKCKYVTLAANEAFYGRYFYIGTVRYASPIDMGGGRGREYVVTDVIGYVHDIGPAFQAGKCERWNTCKDIGRKFDVALGDFRNWNSRNASWFVDSQAFCRNLSTTFYQIGGAPVDPPRVTSIDTGNRNIAIVPGIPGSGGPGVFLPPYAPQQALQVSTGQGATASGGTSGTSGDGGTTNPGTNNDVPGVNSSPTPGPGVATLIVQSQSIRRGNPILVAWSTLGMRADATCKLFLKLPAQVETEVVQGNGGARPVTIPISTQTGIGEMILVCTPITGSAIEKRVSFTVQ